MGREVITEATSEIFCYARDLPAIVLAVEFISKEIKFGLQLGKIFNRAWLTRLQLGFLHVGIHAHRFNRPATVLQLKCGPFGVNLIGKEEVMIQFFGCGQSLIQLLVGFRTLANRSK